MRLRVAASCSEVKRKIWATVISSRTAWSYQFNAESSVRDRRRAPISSRLSAATVVTANARWLNESWLRPLRRSQPASAAEIAAATTSSPKTPLPK
jgi:hypothetical protein